MFAIFAVLRSSIRYSVHLSLPHIPPRTMPHKHTRLNTLASSSSTAATHDLPPTTFARPLSVSKAPPTSNNKKRKHASRNDDTPYAFTQLMHYASTGLKTPNGLDTGPQSHKSKKRKRQDEKEETANAPPAPNDLNAIPKILPGERMRDFAARVDTALPISKGMEEG
ncbi:MAG: hypothetical protein Q9220_000720 [cf. Caloplaca sp. 1 TL-2023]